MITKGGKGNGDRRNQDLMTGPSKKQQDGARLQPQEPTYKLKMEKGKFELRRREKIIHMRVNAHGSIVLRQTLLSGPGILRPEDRKRHGNHLETEGGGGVGIAKCQLSGRRRHDKAEKTGGGQGRQEGSLASL